MLVKRYEDLSYAHRFDNILYILYEKAYESFL
ncbi:hypothetical protein C923_01362 [Plasmodium falciparum UGT5.1]|nr:hypothetical protein C923_01362 [Plasmodium falciparum UGT5.1]